MLNVTLKFHKTRATHIIPRTSSLTIKNNSYWYLIEDPKYGMIRHKPFSISIVRESKYLLTRTKITYCPRPTLFIT